MHPLVQVQDSETRDPQLQSNKLHSQHQLTIHLQRVRVLVKEINSGTITAQVDLRIQIRNANQQTKLQILRRAQVLDLSTPASNATEAQVKPTWTKTDPPSPHAK